LRQGKALDDSRVGARGVGGLAAGVSATGGSEVPGSNPGKKHNTGGVRRLPSMCHAFDLTREAGGETARTADLRCAPFISQGAKASTSLSASRVSDDDDDAILRAALDECVRLVERCDAFSGADDDTAPVGRIALQLPDFDDCAFGSDAYRASRADAEEATIARVTRFLRGLRGILRGGGGGRNAHATQKFKRVCAVVTYPLASLSPSAAASLVHAVDAAIDLETLPEKNANANANETHAFEALLPDPNLCVALLRVRKLAFPGPGAVAPSPLTRMDRTYALQVRRKRLAVRPLRIAPEDAASGSTGKKEKTSSCGGGPADAPNALDF
jgi:elongator complex protein 4